MQLVQDFFRKSPALLASLQPSQGWSLATLSSGRLSNEELICRTVFRGIEWGSTRESQ